MRRIGLEPLIAVSTAALIIGTFPSQQSLLAGRYYEDTRNKFWDIVAPIIQVPRSASYDHRVTALLIKRIGLWDVIAACERAGSADKGITNAEPNDISRVFREHPDIRLILFNGTSQKGPTRYFRRFVRSGEILVPEKMHFDELPSSSSEYRVSVDLKTAQWRKKLGDAGLL